MSEIDDRLDDALSKYLEDPSEIRSDLEPYLPVLHGLNSLRDSPDRDEDLELVGRDAFIEFIKSLSAPVSKMPDGRLKGWKTFFGRERRPMTTVLSIALALMLAFGGVGTTAYAAQDSLPTDPLYPVKEFTEQVRLAITSDMEAEVQLLLDFVNERMEEMVALANGGKEVPEETQLKFQEQLRLALAKAAQLGDPELQGVLQRLQTMTQNQIQTMSQAQENQPADAPCEALQVAIRAMNRVRNDVEEGLSDPTTFRLRQGTNRPEDAPDQPENEPPGKQDPQPGPGGDPSGQGNGNGPNEGSGTNGNGPGDGTGAGDGDGTGNGAGPQGDGNGDGKQD
jgi:hypothetical protein